MIKIYEVLFFVVILHHVNASCSKCEVITENGKLEGTEYNKNNIKYIKFLGIPYAKPPINDLRFKSPQKLEGTNIKQKKNGDTSCVQKASSGGAYTGNEDCLYLNIYTPGLELKGQGYPVMVWIHGGKFNSGSGIIDPSDLVHEQVIVVSINYRLGVFGFLSLQSAQIPGNMGLKDQMMALNWILENIDKFGGNKYSITLFGTDAGAASIHYLLMYGGARHNFNKAIMQSGSAYSPWALQNNVFEHAKAFLTNLGLYTKSDKPKEVVRFSNYEFKQFNTSKVFEAAEKVLSSDNKMQKIDPIFAPVIELNTSKDPIINKTTDEAMDYLQINMIKWRPIILGFNDAEGIEILNYVQNIDSNWMENNNLDQYLPRQVVYTKNNTVEGKSINEALVEEYKLDDQDTRYQLFVKMMGDAWYTYGVYKTATKMIELKKSFNTYLYRFSISDSNLKKDLCQECKIIAGANHGDEVKYIFNNNEVIESNKEKHKKIVKLWTNFAKYENPTTSSAWYKVDSFDNLWKNFHDEQHYFDLNDFSMHNFNSSEYGRLRKWGQVYDAVNKRLEYKKSKKSEKT